MGWASVGVTHTPIQCCKGTFLCWRTRGHSYVGLTLVLPPAWRNAVAMPDRPFPAVEALIRRVQRVAASRPDPMYILAQTISMTGAIGADPYGVLGVLIEGAVETIVQQIPAEQRAETAATLVQLLKDRLNARGVASDDRPGNEIR